MKYDDEFMANKSSGGSGSGGSGQTVKPVVGIIKKSSMAAYRPPVLYSTSRVTENVVEARTITPAGNPDDLLVVAYSSNLYRDDFMALKLESRDMLIPWNGDQNLLIDRYDCRGYLYDLEPYDADLMSDERRNPKYSKEEIEMEHACDLERYMYLKDEEQNDESGPSKNGDDDDSNREIGPSSKRYANIGFSYDGSTTTTANTEANSKNGAEIEQVDKSTDKLFVPDEALQLPLGMLVPETVKMNQIVMKTASFVAKQGLQMEILLKTKQASNSQFDFLNFDNHLNPYYKHLIQLIRDNKIDPMVYLIEPPKQEDDAKKSTESQSDDDNDDDNDDDDNYLHPLLFKKIEPVVKVEQNNKQETNKPVEEETNTTDKKMEETVEKADEKDDKPSEKDDDEVEKVKDEEMKEEEEEKGEEPEGVAKTIIDKLAEYVGRNGREFEKNIAKKDDERFDFIKPGHKHHKYYCRMIEKAKKARRREEEEEERKKRKSDDGDKKKKTRSRSPSSSSSSSSSSDHPDREKKKKRKKDKDKEKEKEKEKDKDKEREKSSSHHKKSSSHHHKSKKKHRKKSKSKDRHR